MFGLGMALATIFFIPSNVEPFVWLAIFVLCAYIISKQCSGKYFLHGFLVSLCNSFWMTSLHIVFSEPYLTNHPEMALMNVGTPMQDSPRIMMVIMGPIIGALSGLFLGLFAFLAAKIVKNKPENIR